MNFPFSIFCASEIFRQKDFGAKSPVGEKQMKRRQVSLFWLEHTSMRFWWLAWEGQPDCSNVQVDWNHYHDVICDVTWPSACRTEIPLWPIAMSVYLRNPPTFHASMHLIFWYIKLPLIMKELKNWNYHMKRIENRMVKSEEGG